MVFHTYLWRFLPSFFRRQHIGSKGTQYPHKFDTQKEYFIGDVAVSYEIGK